MFLTESPCPFSRALGKRPRARASVSFRCIIFSFVTSSIHKKHVQLRHADGCRGNKQQPLACPLLMRISYMKSILGSPWLLGAQGSRLPLPNPGLGNVDPGGPVSLQSLAPNLIKHT